MERLKDRVAIITGSARGIGYGIAKVFASQGAVPIIIDIRQEMVDAAVENLEKEGLTAFGYEADVTDSERIGEIVKEIAEKHGHIDILVNNAGITRDQLILRMKEEDWDKVMEINLKGTFICTQKVSRYMLKQKEGVILNIASVIGIMGNSGQSNYAASKGGIIAFTKSTAKELASRNIRVNAIAPGFIETEMTAGLPDEVVRQYQESIPMKKMGQIVDVANLCLFLASDEAGYINGQTINVDGGLVM